MASHDPLTHCERCRDLIPVSRLNKHLRQHLRYKPYACGLCQPEGSLQFYLHEDARNHFSAFGPHGDVAPLITESLDIEKEKLIKSELDGASGIVENSDSEPILMLKSMPQRSKISEKESDEEIIELSTSRATAFKDEPLLFQSFVSRSDESYDEYIDIPAGSVATSDGEVDDVKSVISRNQDLPDLAETPGEERIRIRAKSPPSIRRSHLSQLTCHLCFKRFKGYQASIAAHIACHHLSRAAIVCSFCDYNQRSWSLVQVRWEHHFKTKHPGRKISLQDRRPELRKEFLRLRMDCFGDGAEEESSEREIRQVAEDASSLDGSFPRQTTKLCEESGINSEAISDCKACGEAVPERLQKQHVASKHVKSLNCGHCGQSFSSSQQVRIHCVNLHPELSPKIAGDARIAESWNICFGSKSGSENSNSADPSSAVMNDPPAKNSKATEITVSSSLQLRGLEIRLPRLEGQDQENLRNSSSDDDKVRCRDCDMAISGIQMTCLATHILIYHLKKPRAVCKLCGWKTYDWNILAMRNHIIRHKRPFSVKSDDIVDNWQALREDLSREMELCFGKKLRPHQKKK